MFEMVIYKSRSRPVSRSKVSEFIPFVTHFVYLLVMCEDRNGHASVTNIKVCRIVFFNFKKNPLEKSCSFQLTVVCGAEKSRVPFPGCFKSFWNSTVRDCGNDEHPKTLIF